jgi:hypothetical protein
MRSWSSASFPLVLALTLPLVSCGSDGQGPTQSGALVVTSDFQSGALSSIDLDTRQVSKNIGTVHSDAVCRAHGTRAYVVNRLGQDNIQVLDPSAGYSTLLQFSTGNGSNPQDICFASDQKAYVPLYGRADLLVVNPETGATLGSVDLGSLADADGNPEMSACAVVGDRVYVALQNLHDFVPTGTSRIAIVDARSDTLVRGEPLQGQNPFTALLHDAPRDRLLVGAVGNFGVLDGGIEAFDLRTERSAGLVITEQALGGDVGMIALLNASKGFAIVTDASFATSLVSFDPQAGRKLATVYASRSFDLSTVALDDRGELYVGDANFTAPGVRIFDAASDRSLIPAPLDVGLPPRDICFAAQ